MLPPCSRFSAATGAAELAGLTSRGPPMREPGARAHRRAGRGTLPLWLALSLLVHAGVFAVVGEATNRFGSTPPPMPVEVWSKT